MTGGTQIFPAPGPITSDLSHREPRRRYSWLIVACILGLIVWSAIGTESDPRLFFRLDAWLQIGSFLRAWFPPDLSPAFVHRSLWGGVETIAVSLMGTVLAVLIAFPLGVASSRTIYGSTDGVESRHRAFPVRMLQGMLYWASTLSLNLLRSIPEVFWALIFILAVGLGPFAGVLALGVHTGGVLGKLFSEVMESVDRRPIEALQGTGAGVGSVLAYGMIPLTLPQFVAYTLYRWEVNIRAAAIIGIVGAGGLGREIYVAIGLFQYQRLSTLLLLTLVVVSFVDYLSARLRSGLQV